MPNNQHLYCIFFSNSQLVYFFFNVKISKVLKKQSNYSNLKHKFDLTTILLKIVLNKYVKKNFKILEIGIGSFGILSIFFNKKYQTNSYAVDIDLLNINNSSINVIFNDAHVNIIHSNIFENLVERNFDIIFWNLPYYEDKNKYLYPLITNCHKYLNNKGKLIVGYNSMPLKEKEIIEFTKKNYNLKYLKGIKFSWNNHIVSIIEKDIL